ncbi:MAG: AGE family epimerase/isomerase [Oceanospirillaceae bacterium]
MPFIPGSSAILEPLVHANNNYFDVTFLNQHIDKTMAFYHPHCIDKKGGFFHYFRDDGSIYNSSSRHLVSSTRFIFNYAMAAINTEQAELKKQYLLAVQHGLDFLRNVHLNPLTKGYAWQLEEGVVSDGTNHCYGLAFVMLAYSTALKAGVTSCKAYIAETYELMEQHFWDQNAQLYADERSADWLELSDYRGQNANMHSCEGMIAAFEATAEPYYLDRAMQLAQGICVRQSALADNRIWEHYTSDWQIDWAYNLDDPKNLFRPWGFQPGHFTEWAKLLLILDRYRPTSWLLPKAQHLFDMALDLSWDSEQGGINYGFAPDGSVCDDDKYFWVQAESFAAAALLCERVQTAQLRDKYQQIYTKIWQYSWTHMIDHQQGAWYRILKGDNTKYDNLKSPAGKTDYHTMGACYEVLSMLKRSSDDK